MHERNWWLIVAAFLVCLGVEVLTAWIGFTFGIEMGARRQAEKDRRGYMAAINAAARQAQEAWFQLGRMRKAWNQERAKRDVNRLCECCHAQALGLYCKECGQLQEGKQVEL